MSAPEAPKATRRVLVTGGAGFIGSHVTDTFLAAGYEALVIDDLSAGREENVPTGAELEQLDIVDQEVLARVTRAFRPSVVCHLAAQASVTVSVQEPERDFAVNVRGTFNVVEAAREQGAPVVFASTGGALYGESAPSPSPESTWAEPLAPYGASKLAGEAYVATWGRLHGIRNVVLRLGNVYGPRQSPHGEAGVVAIFSDKLRLGQVPTVFGDGRQTRDYIYVSDVASAFLLAAESGLAAGEGSGPVAAPLVEGEGEGPWTFNVGWGQERSVLDLLEVLQALAPAPVEPVFQPLRPGELTHSALDATRLRRTLGWEPQVGLEEGLTSTYRSYTSAEALATPGE